MMSMATNEQTDLQRSNIYQLPQHLKELLAFRALVPTTLLASLRYLGSFLRPRSEIFSPANSIPDISDEVILVTGGNTGIGKETVLQLAKFNPKRIYLASRSISKAEVAIKDIKLAAADSQITFLQLDLMSFDSIRKAANHVMAESSRLDVLILNSGNFSFYVDHV
jgi:FlaA1/EpsC-like NDP-sugar epimerase